MVQSHVSFSANSHFFWPHQIVHYSLSSPLEKMQTVCEDYEACFYPAFLFYFLPVICLKTPFKCAAKG